MPLSGLAKNSAQGARPNHGIGGVGQSPWLACELGRPIGAGLVALPQSALSLGPRAATDRGAAVAEKSARGRARPLAATIIIINSFQHTHNTALVAAHQPRRAPTNKQTNGAHQKSAGGPSCGRVVCARDKPAHTHTHTRARTRAPLPLAPFARVGARRPLTSSERRAAHGGQISGSAGRPPARPSPCQFPARGAGASGAQLVTGEHLVCAS